MDDWNDNVLTHQEWLKEYKKIGYDRFIKKHFPDTDWYLMDNTFNGYNYWINKTGKDKCGLIANECIDEWYNNKKLPKTLILLRTSLFFENRRARHSGEDPDEEYINGLINEIKRKLRQGDLK